jgi:quercetin dioxygenase-like cupin family protein
LHRAPVETAIADVQAFLDQDTIPHPKLSEVIDVHATGSAGSGPNLLGKGESFEIRRLTLPQGRTIPTHHAAGEITVHCLNGRIAFTADGQTRELGAGQLIFLAAGEPHSLVSLEDAQVLVTKIQPIRS